MFDVLGEDWSGKLIYKIKVGTKEKIGKYEGMRVWLREMGQDRMIRVLDSYYNMVEVTPEQQVLKTMKVSETKGLRSCYNKEMIFD